MKRFYFIVSWAAASAFACSCCTSWAQQSFYQQIRSNNASMTEVQPSWMGPLIQSDGRLGQALRLSVSNSSWPGAHVLNYGDGHGVSMIVARRFQVDLDPPAFFRNHAKAFPDGFGNAGTQVKYRLASGNAEHGNFAVSAVLYHAFAPRIGQNQLLTSFYAPSIAAGKGYGRLALLSNVGGFLPTGKIDQQGRAVEWNSTVQFHTTAHTWIDLENNTTFIHGGPFDGQTQNFATPAGFLMIRRKEWGPEHGAVVFAAGEQIATTAMHYYNHNLITEMRILF